MYLKMYLTGNEQKVWNEIEALQVNELSKEHFDDVLAVCRETMKRVKVNTERIVETLKASGYDLSKYQDGEKHFFESGITAPDSEVESKIKYIESICGPIPLSLKVFWETIGSISLVGFSQNWPEYSDPLFVASINDNIEIIEEWQAFRKECDDHAEDPFILYISPDEDQKDNCEGGQYYNIELPCKTIDGTILDVPEMTSFVAYLREAFDAKGFLGLEEIPDSLKDLDLVSI